MIKPPLLKKGDKAVIVSPGGNINPDWVYATSRILSEWGLDVQISTNCLQQSGRFSGSVEQRLSDLQTAMDDPSVRHIFCSRGGYGTIHLLQHLDFRGIRQNPKWVLGFSDISVILAALLKNGICSLHAPMAEHYALEGNNDDAVLYTKRVLFGESITYQDNINKTYANITKQGQAIGNLFGGNLAVLCGLMGTPYFSVPKNGILFIEDVDEQPYKVDRFIHQLKLSGIFNELSGLIVGQFTHYNEDDLMYKKLYASIADCVDEYEFPVCFDFPVGHIKKNYPLIVGHNTCLTISDKAVCLTQNQ